MSTSSSNTAKTVKCSVKDLANTLYSCSFPTEFSDEERDPSKLCTASGKTMSDQNVDESREKDLKENKGMQKKVKYSAGRKVTSDEANWPSFSNEDYMVFCFKEDDGGIDLEEIVLPVTERKESAAPTPKGVEKERKHPFTEIPPAAAADDEEHVKVINEVHARLSDSARSDDSSSSSFAFPAMSTEWRGSPVRMPKLGARSKTRKIRSLIPCLRF